MIVVTGSTGQLGFELHRILAGLGANAPVTFLSSAELDLRNSTQIKKVIADLRPALFINAAAYTRVDKAESEPQIARQINTEAPAQIATLAREMAFHLIHISTDYVFDGKASRPYTEDDPVCPQSVYGKSKADGERAVLDILPSALILRTSWVYSSHGKNFVKTVLRFADECKTGKTVPAKMRVVFDQVGSLTYARDLAQTLLAARDLSGIFNYSNEGAASWYDVACTIKKIKGLPLEIEPILTRDYPTDARRPHYSVLDKTKLKTALNIKIPHWQESLEKCLSEIS